jgi:hypothetical protein
MRAHRRNPVPQTINRAPRLQMPRAPVDHAGFTRRRGASTHDRHQPAFGHRTKHVATQTISLPDKIGPRYDTRKMLLRAANSVGALGTSWPIGSRYGHSRTPARREAATRLAAAPSGWLSGVGTITATEFSRPTSAENPMAPFRRRAGASRSLSVPRQGNPPHAARKAEAHGAGTTIRLWACPYPVQPTAGGQASELDTSQRGGNELHVGRQEEWA